MTDKRVAAALGVSQRTVQRRRLEIEADLGAGDGKQGT
jgi:FixJ family two-component response regulator